MMIIYQSNILSYQSSNFKGVFFLQALRNKKWEPTLFIIHCYVRLTCKNTSQAKSKLKIQEYAFSMITAYNFFLTFLFSINANKISLINKSFAYAHWDVKTYILLFTCFSKKHFVMTFFYPT